MSDHDYVIRVSYSSGDSIRVVVRDHTGLADGLFTKSQSRYFRGENRAKAAIAYAENRAEELDDAKMEVLDCLKQDE